MALDACAVPDFCVAAQCRPPRTTAPPPRESCPTSAVAVAVRVLPPSMETCVVEVKPLMANRPPGTAMLFTVVVASEVGWVVALAASLPMPKPLACDWGVMEDVRLWFPFVDSAWTGGGTSAGREGRRTPVTSLRLERGADGAEVDGLGQRPGLEVLVVRDGGGENDGVIEASGRRRQADGLRLCVGVAGGEGLRRRPRTTRARRWRWRSPRRRPGRRGPSRACSGAPARAFSAIGVVHSPDGPSPWIPGAQRARSRFPTAP